jgi:nitrous oxidase accessory protein
MIFRILVILLFATTFIFASNITVCKDCLYKNVKDAIIASHQNDTIFIQKGIYREHEILIDKSLTILGLDFPVIDGENKGEIIKIIADGVTLDGLIIKNVGRSYTQDNAAVRVTKSSYFLLQNLILENLFFGIYIEKSNQGKISRNKIKGNAVEEYNSGNGIQLWYSEKVIIEDNSISQVRDGIYLEFATDCTIRNNVSFKNIRYGLHFMFSNNDTYENNTFDDNGAGVAVMFSKHILMHKNKFLNNWGAASYGLLLKEINDSEITENLFQKNTIGINIEGSNRVTYQKNDFIANGWAVKSRGACYANRFLDNNFIQNSFDLSYNSKLNDNLFENNYWSDYTGYDLNKDGTGDIPYRPVKLFTYITNRTPEAIILLRSLFIDIINFSEKVSPIFTPENLQDKNPRMKMIRHD